MVKIQNIRKQTAPSKTTRKISQITKIARHHSATTSGDYFSFWAHWKSKGWTKGGYHEIILPDGTVQLCYDPIYPTNGVGGHNTYIYNICLVGNGAFTAAQERAFEERCLLAMQSFGIGVDGVLGHNEFRGTSTACPGINMDTVRARLAKLTTGKITAASTDTEEEVDGMKLVLNNHEKTRLAEIFANARKKGTFSSDEHEKAIMDGTMTVAKLAYLTAIIANSK